MDTQRASFALDIPADGTPAFGITAYDPAEGKGGLVWKVRMNFLVAVAAAAPYSASPDSGGETIRNLVKDGPRGEWGLSLRASDSLAPLGRVSTQRSDPGGDAVGMSSSRSGDPPPSSHGGGTSGGGWTSMLFGSNGGGSSSSQTSLTTSLDDEGDSDDANEVGARKSGVDDDVRRTRSRWAPLEVQTVECEVPVSVWPGATAFRPRESVFEC